jgi:hypothetical protein
MSKPYSLDLRERVVEFVEAGASRHEAAEGQVRRLLDIFTGAASFENCVLRPTWASYS